MVKKLKKLAEKQASAPTGLLDGLMGGALKDSAQQLWHAGQEALSMKAAQRSRGRMPLASAAATKPPADTPT